MDIVDATGDAGHLLDALELLSQFEHLSLMALQGLNELPTVTPGEKVLRLGLLARSEPTRYLSSLATALEAWVFANPLPDPAVPTIVPPGLVMIGDTLARSTSTSDIPMPGRFSKSAQPFVSASAMQGLRRLKDLATVPLLITQLDSPENYVRYLAVVTLPEITGKSGEFGPGKGLFDKDESKYIDLRKNWSRERAKDSR